MKFHEKLYQLRKTAGMTQSELAEKLNVSRQAVSRWEMGTATPEIDSLITMCDIFDVTLDFLLRDKTDSDKAAASDPLPEQPRYWDFLPGKWWIAAVLGIGLKLAYYVYFLWLWLFPQSMSGTAVASDGASLPVMILFSVPMWNLYSSLFLAITGLCFVWALVKWLKARKGDTPLGCNQ